MSPPHRDWVPETGAFASAKAATAEKGRIMAEEYRARIAAAVVKEFGLNWRPSVLKTGA